MKFFFRWQFPLNLLSYLEISPSFKILPHLKSIPAGCYFIIFHGLPRSQNTRFLFCSFLHKITKCLKIILGFHLCFLRRKNPLKNIDDINNKYFDILLHFLLKRFNYAWKGGCKISHHNDQDHSIHSHTSCTETLNKYCKHGCVIFCTLNIVNSDLLTSIIPIRAWLRI